VESVSQQCANATAKSLQLKLGQSVASSRGAARKCGCAPSAAMPSSARAPSRWPR
jgi:hypothetical protein